MSMKKSLVLLGTILLLAVILVACGGKPEPTATAVPTELLLPHRPLWKYPIRQPGKPLPITPSIPSPSAIGMMPLRIRMAFLWLVPSAIRALVIRISWAPMVLHLMLWIKLFRQKRLRASSA